MKRAALFFVAYVFLFSANGMIAFAGCGGPDEDTVPTPQVPATVAPPVDFTPVTQESRSGRSLFDLYRRHQLTDYPDPNRAELEDISPLVRALSDDDGLGSKRAWLHQVMLDPWMMAAMQLSEEEQMELIKEFR